MIEPLISVLVPTYNQDKYIGLALDSLLAQTYQNWEAIVVNDGSTDTTEVIIENYASRDRRFKVVHKDNGGTVSALNTGLRFAQGDWIGWLSSDDEYEPSKLKVHVDEINRRPEIKFFFTHCYYFDESTNSKVQPELNFPQENFRVSTFLKNNFVNGITILAHRTVFQKIGFFDSSYPLAHDVEMWMRIIANYEAGFINERLSVSRLHDERLTNTAGGLTPYDHSHLANAFVNNHILESIYPQHDMTSLQSVMSVIQNIFQITFDQNAIIHLMGFSDLLLYRLLEWYTKRCHMNIKRDVYTVLVRLFKEVLKGGCQDCYEKSVENFLYSMESGYDYKPRNLLEMYLSSLLESVADKGTGDFINQSRYIRLRQDIDQ